MSETIDLRKAIRTVPDFPKKGVMFRDVTTLFNNSEAFGEMIDQFETKWADIRIDAIAGIDARGFVIGGALAYKMRLPFIALRKQGKLPHDTIAEEYELEYGTATLEVHRDSVEPGTSVLIVDDLIATGGTAIAGANLISALGGKIAGCGFLVELPDLGGGSNLRAKGIQVRSITSFAGH
jgi:adenine phosphoribosyltransferase